MATFVWVPNLVYANGWEHGAISFEVLVQALDFEAPDMRLRAAQSLGARGQLEALKPLLARLRKPEKNARVRAAIYAALGRLADRRGVPVLLTGLAEESREELRSDCATALGLIGDNRALVHLLKALKEDSSFLVKSSVVDALGGFRSKPAVAALIEIIEHGADRSLRSRAIGALGATGAPGAVKPLLNALSDSKTDSQRLLIVRSLANLKPKEASKALTDLLQKTDDLQLRTHIIMVLGIIQASDTYSVLVKMLKGENPAVQFFIVRSLLELERPEAVIPISKLSLEISRRLDRLSEEDISAHAVTILADLSLQWIILQAITDLDAPRGLEALLKAARTRSIPRDSSISLKIAEGFYRQQRAALHGLGYTNSPKAARLLAGPSGLGNADFRLRAVAVHALGVLGFADAAKQVVPALNDSSAEVRWTAAKVLGLLGTPDAIDTLIETLTDINSEVRRQGAMSLGYLGGDAARSVLEKVAVHDENQNVRAAAAFSLKLLAK